MLGRSSAASSGSVTVFAVPSVWGVAFSVQPVHVHSACGREVGLQTLAATAPGARCVLCEFKKSIMC